MDDCCDTDNSVGDRAGEQLHDGRVNSHPAGNCHYRSAAQHHSGAKTFWIKEGYQPNQVDNRNEEQNENKYTDCHHLIAIGIVAFAYQGITYTTREKVVDLGPIQVSADKTRTLPLPPIVGGIALVGGIVLLVMGNKKG